MQNQIGFKVPQASKSPVIAEFNSFSFTNSQGGTGMSDWDHNPRYAGIARAQIFKAWNDYETGLHFVGIGIDDDLIAYLATNAKADTQRVYISEHDLIDPASGLQLYEALAESAGVVRTEDGYIFRKMENGKWGDSDMTYDNLSQLMAEVTVTVEIEVPDANKTDNQSRRRAKP